MKLSNPIVWAIIGGFFGFFAAIGGQNEFSPILDGITGALIQSVIWFAISWAVIRILKKYPVKISKMNHKLLKKKSNKFTLRIWFVIAFSAPTIGALISEWSNAALTYGIPIDFFDQLSNLFSPAVFIDIFIFPSLASALTITSSIYFYRKSYAKLKNQNKKYYLMASYITATIIFWIVLSVLLAMLVSRN